MAAEVYIPKLGQTVEEVTIIGWLMEDGAQVKQGDEILEVETDKATFPVEANASGYLHIGPYQEGDVVAVLAVVAIIGEADETFEVERVGKAPVAPSTVEPQAAQAEAPPAQTLAVGRDGDRPFASPRARKRARAEGVDLRQVTPTGGGGIRIVEQDVTDHLSQLPKATPVAQKMAAGAGLDLRQIVGTGSRGTITKADVARSMQAPAAPTVAPLPEVEVVERIPLSGVRGIIAERMATSVHTTARVTLLMDVDATDFVGVRERLKVQVSEEWGFTPGYNDLLGKIVAAALRKFPYMNARLAPDAIEHVADINLGMAVDTERGLLVPVIRNADQKSLQEFGTEFRELAERARTGRSLPDDLTGGTFTITNLGMYAISGFTPVINLPEAAILGVGCITPTPVVRDGQVVVRDMMTLSLVFDHRLVDGAPAARFLQYIKELVELPYLWVTEGV
jgi:pyruvate dehydrogenase E2 component (dihydrolipoamide acetyltransferase)